MKNKLINPNLNQNNFDILRFILATSVIFCHCYAIYYGYEKFVQNEPFMKWSGGQISIGSFAVNFFFVISGFLIVKSFESSSSLLDYLKKRLLRIYPGFIVAFLVSIIIFAPIGHLKEFNVGQYLRFLGQLPLKRELANMLSLQSPVEAVYFNHLPQKGLNNSLWTIQYEFTCYLLVPVLAVFGIKKNRKWVLAALVICYALFILQSMGLIFSFNNQLNGGIIGNPYYYLRFFTYFLCGAVCYLYRDKIVASAWLALFSLAFIVTAFIYKKIDWFLPFTGSYLLFYLAYLPKLQYPAFSKHGDFSYGIYLYGWPLQQLFMLFLWQYLTPWRFFVLVFPIVLIFAVISWKIIEEPALRLKNKPFLFKMKPPVFRIF